MTKSVLDKKAERKAIRFRVLSIRLKGKKLMEKERVLSIRVKEKEKQRIDNEARAAGYASTSEYVRCRMLYGNSEQVDSTQTYEVQRDGIYKRLIRLQHYFEELPAGIRYHKEDMQKEVEEIWHMLN